MSTEIVWETDCQFVNASFSEFDRWVNANKRLEETGDNIISSSNKHPRTDDKLSDLPKLSDFDPETYAAYADYKYMKDLFLELPEYKQGIDWSTFGFPELTGEQSTFWMGTKGAYTPCHYDTYGFNLVAQLHGRKKWTLFSPHQCDCLYPTRLPYEESSVFSQVNIKRPDFNRHPCFRSAEPFQVTLEPGQVLFVPKHWWHFVECLETSISVNTWVNVDSDCIDRVEEAVIMNVMMSMKNKNSEETGNDNWMTPSQVSLMFVCLRHVSFHTKVVIALENQIPVLVESKTNNPQVTVTNPEVSLANDLNIPVPVSANCELKLLGAQVPEYQVPLSNLVFKLCKCSQLFLVTTWYRKKCRPTYHNARHGSQTIVSVANIPAPKSL
jgi:HSPB1-associated protein 1